MVDVNDQLGFSNTALENSYALGLKKQRRQELEQRKLQNMPGALKARNFTDSSKQDTGSGKLFANTALGGGGEALDKAGQALTRTKFGAIAGLPMMLAGKAAKAKAKSNTANKSANRLRTLLKKKGDPAKKAEEMLNPLSSQNRLSLAFKSLWTVIGFFPSLAYLNFHFIANFLGFKDKFCDMTAIQKVTVLIINLLAVVLLFMSFIMPTIIGLGIAKIISLVL